MEDISREEIERRIAELDRDKPELDVQYTEAQYAEMAVRMRAQALAMRMNPDPYNRMPIRVEPQQGRNEPCACNSGKKFKRCCGA